MFAKYSYLAGASQANIMNDVVLMLTGTTDKTLLSASCNQANTEILATYEPAGWILHDAAAGTNAKVIKAPCVGDAAQFKYVKITTNVSAGTIQTGLWESWNEVTHIGTNLASTSETANCGQRWATGAPGSLYISASAGRIVLYGASSAGNGCAQTNGSCSGVIEADRGFNWCGVGTGFVPAVFFQGNEASMPRHIDASGNVAASSATKSRLVTMGMDLAANSTYATAYGTGVPMSGGSFALPLAPLMAIATAATATAVSGFSNAEVWILMAGYANTLDESSYDAKVRVMFPFNALGLAQLKMALPKG